ncbi:hypothetical protein Fmac_016891 [Flemingia macrophylla]|uniref:Small ribosomal subunit protein eS31 domain-containing protein n=1 Tax=Flemingia macrophylla TaxID=520843 RepID=A0ABD1MIR6_9FABA
MVDLLADMGNIKCNRDVLGAVLRLHKKESTLDLVLRLCGGAKKRKKTYTKPKKVKLAILQFYKVDGTGKVHRLRKEYPNADCGAGTFMANHFDRHQCLPEGQVGKKGKLVVIGQDCVEEIQALRSAGEEVISTLLR